MDDLTPPDPITVLREVRDWMDHIEGEARLRRTEVSDRIDAALAAAEEPQPATYGAPFSDDQIAYALRVQADQLTVEQGKLLILEAADRLAAGVSPSTPPEPEVRSLGPLAKLPFKTKPWPEGVPLPSPEGLRCCLGCGETNALCAMRIAYGKGGCCDGCDHSTGKAKADRPPLRLPSSLTNEAPYHRAPSVPVDQPATDGERIIDAAKRLYSVDLHDRGVAYSPLKWERLSDGRRAAYIARAALTRPTGEPTPDPGAES